MLFAIDRQDADPIVLRVDAGVGGTDERHERAVGGDRRLAVGAVVAGERSHVRAVDRSFAVGVDDVQVACSIAVPGGVALR
jgi:6,7-dimethyl-8-ribityllumazine synthase